MFSNNTLESIIILAGNNSEAQEFLGRGGQVIIRMRGLPYDCSAKQVVSIGGVLAVTELS